VGRLVLRAGRVGRIQLRGRRLLRRFDRRKALRMIVRWEGEEGFRSLYISVCGFNMMRWVLFASDAFAFDAVTLVVASWKVSFLACTASWTRTAA
jgi:hypothetical protein